MPIKLTIVADEYPDLFSALLRVQDRRRRTRRLQALAALGLVFEQAGGAALMARATGHPAESGAGESARPVPVGETVASMLDWESNT
jgi:hypothetical protein